jgi:hypothetical protein
MKSINSERKRFSANLNSFRIQSHHTQAIDHFQHPTGIIADWSAHIFWREKVRFILHRNIEILVTRNELIAKKNKKKKNKQTNKQKKKDETNEQTNVPRLQEQSDVVNLLFVIARPNVLHHARVGIGQFVGNEAEELAIRQAARV